MERIIGKKVKGKIDRPLGSRHPKYHDLSTLSITVMLKEYLPPTVRSRTYMYWEPMSL